jgi:hypothetical protein
MLLKKRQTKALPFFPIPNCQDFVQDVHKGSYVPSSLSINIGGKSFS